MKKRTGTSLNHLNLFNIDRLDTYNNFEGGTSLTYGFDYELKNPLRNLNFSIGQVVNQKNNKNKPSSSSLDKKFSDFVGSSTLNINDNLELGYNYALDQNYQDFNNNEIGASFTLG